jgi:hypothetical protein
VEIRAVNAVTITAAAREATRPTPPQLDESHTVTDIGGKSSKKVRGRVLKNAPKFGVEGCGRKAAAPAHTASLDQPTGTTRRPSDPTPEVPRCA